VSVTAARLLEERHAGNPDVVAAQLAEHFYRGNDRQKALQYSVLAGHRAVAVFAHEEAIRHYETALGLMNELQGSGPDCSREQRLERARLLEALGHEEPFLAQFSSAVVRLEEAAQLYEELGERHSAGSNLLAAGNIRAWALRSLGEGLTLMLRARVLVESEPESRLHAELCLRLGEVAVEVELPQLPPVRALLEQALSVARSAHAPDLEARALIGLAWLEPPEGRETARRNLTAALELARQQKLVDGPSVLWQYVWGMLWMDGDTPGAFGTIDEGIRWCQRIRDRGSEMGFEGTQLPMALLLTGEVDRAAAGARAGAQFHKEVGLPDVLNSQVRAHLELMAGNLDQASALLDSARSLLRTGPDTPQFVYECYLDGWLQEERGNPVGALAAFETGIASCDRRGYPAVVATLWALPLARAAIGSMNLPDSAEAERRAAHFRERLDRIADQIPVPANRGLALRARAAWETHHGRKQDAIRTLEESAACWQQVGWPYERALTLYALGVAYEQSEDSKSAGRAFDEALDLFTKLRAGRDIERVLSRRARPTA
jgi:tetratricopeptide (TPR) repeat protein